MIRKVGEKEDLLPVELDVSRQAADEIPPYARLLQSAMAGDTSLFAREDLVECPVADRRAGTWQYDPSLFL